MERTKEVSLVLSTGHITEEDSKLLEKTVRNRDVSKMCDVAPLPYPFKVIDHGEGWMIYIPQEAIIPSTNTESYIRSVACEKDQEVYALPEFSRDFCNLLILAQKEECAWLNLDRDIETEEDLPVFDW